MKKRGRRYKRATDALNRFLDERYSRGYVLYAAKTIQIISSYKGW